MTMTETLKELEGFIGRSQLSAMIDGCRGEEGQYFREVMREYAQRIATMPKTYEQSEAGDLAVVHLHYFVGGCDWFITEKDCEVEQHQAFGLADLGYGAELGYISLPEILQCGAELDLHFTPRTLQALGLVTI